MGRLSKIFLCLGATSSASFLLPDFSSEEFQSGSSAKWWDDDHAERLRDVLWEQSPEVLESHFFNAPINENGASRAVETIMNTLDKIAEDMAAKRDTCWESVNPQPDPYESMESTTENPPTSSWRPTTSGTVPPTTMYYRKRRDDSSEGLEVRKMKDGSQTWDPTGKPEKDIPEIFWQHARWIREEIFIYCPTMAFNLVSTRNQEIMYIIPLLVRKAKQTSREDDHSILQQG